MPPITSPFGRELYKAPGATGTAQQFFANGGSSGSPKPPPQSGGGLGSDVFLPPGTQGGGSSGNSALPFYLEGFPEFAPVGFNPVSFPTISAANYNFTDPQAFAKSFGDFQRGQIEENIDTASDYSLKALGTELQGLQYFAPAAAALKRQETSIDNIYNQLNRTSQVNSALPFAGADLEAQRRRAGAYASGRLPDEQLDYARELAIRSRAADTSSFAGFGPRSAQASKVSDLMSAEDRFRISQYGEGLTSQNLANTANLYLAPTEYSDAGQQIRVLPEVGAGRLTYEGLGLLNQATLISPSQALGTVVQQEQFRTTLDQRTNEFNSSGQFQADTFNSSGSLQAAMFNSSGAFTAALGQFQYDAGYLAELQAGNQQQLDTALNLGATGVVSSNIAGGFSAQAATNSLPAITQGIGAVSGALNGVNTVLSSQDTSSGTVGTSGTISTAPNNAVQTTPAQSTGIESAGTAPAAAVQPSGVDASIPAGSRFAQGVPTPAGYVPISDNNDGTYTAVKYSDYNTDLERFAKYANVASNPAHVKDIAVADRNIANSAGLSFVPTEGFKPITTLSSGKKVYSLPAAAQNTNNLAGQDTITNSQLMMAYLGAGNVDIYKYLNKFGEQVSDPTVLTKLDDALSSRGPDAVAQTITNTLIGETPNAETPEGRRFTAGALRIAELWGSLSPGQKSLALSSLAQSATKIKTGRDVSNETVHGTNDLKVRDVMKMNSLGTNGFAVARNWNQLSKISNIAVDVTKPEQVAAVSTQIGTVGFGVQGASVPITSSYLSQIGAKPAPEFGVGAVVLNEGTAVPSGYQQVGKLRSGTVAMPKNLTHSSILRSDNISATSIRKAQQISQGKHPAQKLWSKPATGGVVRGAAGGSAVISGLQNMAKNKPHLFSAVAANSLFENTLNG